MSVLAGQSQVYPVSTAAEAVDFGHEHSEIHRLTLNLTVPGNYRHAF